MARETSSILLTWMMIMTTAYFNCANGVKTVFMGLGTLQEGDTVSIRGEMRCNGSQTHEMSWNSPLHNTTVVVTAIAGWSAYRLELDLPPCEIHWKWYSEQRGLENGTTKVVTVNQTREGFLVVADWGDSRCQRVANNRKWVLVRFTGNFPHMADRVTICGRFKYSKMSYLPWNCDLAQSVSVDKGEATVEIKLPAGDDILWKVEDYFYWSWVIFDKNVTGHKMVENVQRVTRIDVRCKGKLRLQARATYNKPGEMTSCVDAQTTIPPTKPQSTTTATAKFTTTTASITTKRKFRFIVPEIGVV